MSYTRVWDQFITERDRAVFQASGYGADVGFGDRPALLVVDVTREFCGGNSAEEASDDSINTYRNSCGAEAWTAIDTIGRVLEVARKKNIPVLYSLLRTPQAGLFGRGRWADKNARDAELLADRSGNEIVSAIAPQPGELIIKKSKPSVFFGSDLAAYLVDLSVDTLIVCGTTTSGCVRATVVDAFSLNYRVTVVEDATFDRGQASHAVNLFDMHEKYADVKTADEVISYLQGLGGDAVIRDLRNRSVEGIATV